jgi:hypothetical protein
MLVFGSPERGGLVAKGFRLEPPDLRGASFEQLNAFQDRGRALLALTSLGYRELGYVVEMPVSEAAPWFGGRPAESGRMK